MAHDDGALAALRQPRLRLGKNVAETAEVEDNEDEGSIVLRAIDRAIESRWSDAQVRARDLDPDELDCQADLIKKTFSRELGAVGAAVGGMAAVPGIGTGAALAAIGGELALNITRTTDMILTIGALHGHDRASVEERRAWVLSVLAFGNGASAGFTKLAGELGIGLGKKATAAIPMSALSAINRALGRTIFTKYGTKRGAIALGRALPFGFGMVIGGGANYVLTNRIGEHAHKFFTELPDILRPAAASELSATK